MFALKPGRTQTVYLHNTAVLRNCGGFTILELLVTMGIIGVLLALILPAVQMARESARCLQCQSQLKQIGMALHNYADTYNCFPAGWRADSSRRSALGWATAILPQLDHESLFHRIRLAPAVDRSDLSDIRATSLPIFICPSDVAMQQFSLYAEDEKHEAHGVESEEVLTNLPFANYVGVFGSLDPDVHPNDQSDGVFMWQQTIALKDIRRGLSETLMVGERTASKLPSTWLGFLVEGEDASARVVGFADKGPNHDEADECEFSSRHTDGANFLWADGHVSSLSRSIDATLYRTFSRRFP